MGGFSRYIFDSTALFLDRLPIARSILGARNGLRIIYYHKVSEQKVPYYFDNGISSTVFEGQLDHLQKTFKFITLSEALSRAQEGQSLSGYVCITFDDGFRECYTHIFRTLKSRGIKATFFLIEECLENKTLMWRNKVLSIQNSVSKGCITELISQFSAERDFNLPKDLMSLSWQWSMDEKEKLATQMWEAAAMPDLDNYLQKHTPYLSNAHVREMIDDGQEIGVHTRTHPICGRLTQAQVDDEIVGSWRRLSDRFDTPINSFSYPFGVRCSDQLEQYIKSQTDLEIILGIRDDLSNGLDASRWERRGMETGYGRSVSLFYFAPWRRKISKS